MKDIIFPFFANSTVLATLVLLILLGLLLFEQSRFWLKKILSPLSLPLIFFISLLATFGSLLFSEVLGWKPCKLCWFQRIFMYPQVLIAAVGILKKDKNTYLHHRLLSLFGFFVALFHYLIQWEVIKGIDCNLVSSSANCIKINFYAGFVSIPFMAVVSFLLIFILSFFYEPQKENPKN